MNGKEFKKQEYKIELKMVALISVDDINELKNKIPELIKNRISQYDYPYVFKKNKKISVHNTNMRANIKCKISEYDNITQQEKDFMNKDVYPIRKDTNKTFTEKQSIEIGRIYRKMERELLITFNNSLFFKDWSEPKQCLNGD